MAYLANAHIDYVKKKVCMDSVCVVFISGKLALICINAAAKHSHDVEMGMIRSVRYGNTISCILIL